MGNTENAGNNSRPKCVWRVKQFGSKGKATGSISCGSEERIFEVKGRGRYTGRSRTSPICQKHIPDAIREWDYDTAAPIDSRCIIATASSRICERGTMCCTIHHDAGETPAATD